ncbi:WD40 repeat-like protein, partial [Serendipita vermifera]
DENRVIFCSKGWGLGSCDVATGKLTSTLFEGDINDDTILSSCPNRSRVICVHDGSFYLWDGTSGERIGIAPLGHRSIKCLAVSPNGTRIALGCENGTLELWDATTGLCRLAGWNAHDKGIMCLAFSPDGARIVSTSYDKPLRLWDAITYSNIGVMMEEPIGWIDCLAFSSDGHRIVSGINGKLHILDGLTGASIGGSLEGHTSEITCLSFFASNTRIVSGSYDGTLQLWNVAIDESVEVNQERHTFFFFFFFFFFCFFFFFFFFV